MGIRVDLWTKVRLGIIGIISACVMGGCGDKQNQESDTQALDSQVLTKIPLELETNNTLESLMDKIFIHNMYDPPKEILIASKEKLIESMLPSDNDKTNSQNIPYLNAQISSLPAVEEKRYEIAQIYQTAYQESKTHAIQVATLESVLQLKKEWEILTDSSKEYQGIVALENLRIQIELALAALFLGYQEGDTQTFEALLNQQYQTAKGTGELNVIIESQIQYRLIALFGLNQLERIANQQPNQAQQDVKKAFRATVKKDLERYKDFLPKKHYEVYQKTLALLLEASLSNEAPMDRVLFKLFEYPSVTEMSIENESNMYERFERLRQAYNLSKNKALVTSQNEVQQIVQISHNPLKNVFETQSMGYYCYGLDYLSLAFVDFELIDSVRDALAYLQKDFKYYQIIEHRFDAPSFRNYIASMLLSAYALLNVQKYQEQFDEVVRLVKSELTQYRDAIDSNEFELYKDAIQVLENPDSRKFNTIELVAKEPVEEEGYIKVFLALSPQEYQQIQDINGRLQRDRNNGASLEQECLLPEDIDFMLSLAYQAFKSQGYVGVAPEMLSIRLDEVFDIRSLDFQEMRMDIHNQRWLGQHLVDFDRFIVLGIADRDCYTDFEMMQRMFQTLQSKQKICGANVFFDKENALVLSDLSPTKSLEIMPDGRVYFRLNKNDFLFNQLLFQNDERSLKALIQAHDKSKTIGYLIHFFPSLTAYLQQRSSVQEAQALISREGNIHCY